jgi:hypothetical protein
MLSWILQITIISIILIFLVHHLIHFFKDTLTVPKIKDLVNAPTKKYENMFVAMNNQEKNNRNVDFNNESYKNSLIPPSVSNIDVISMKNELKNYLKSQHTSIDNTENNLKKVKITELVN